jgi:hypothetical protein
MRWKNAQRKTDFDVGHRICRSKEFGKLFPVFVVDLLA